MSDHVLKPSELKLLLRSNGIKNYKWKGFLNGGTFPKMLLENTINSQVLIGKIVSLPTEELRIWPKLQHENLNPLLEILCIDTSKVRILISPAVGKSIGNVIQDNSFIQHPMCYERKKSYARDVLMGVNYMHQNNVCLLNLNDTNVEVNAYTDKAMICDFSYASSRKKIAISSLPSGIHYRPPEVENQNNGENFSAAPIDVWYCGLLFLQVFTQHLLPSWCGAVKYSLEYLDGELLKKANVGASLQQRDAIYLKRFLKNLLYPYPDQRISAEEAFKLDFLQIAHDRLDRKARQFWKTGAVTVHQEQHSLTENKFTNSETGSLYSEIDVLTVSESNASANLHHNEPMGMAHLVRTKSVPNTKISDEPLNPDIQVRASVPALYRKDNSVRSLALHEEEHASKTNSRESNATRLQSALRRGSRHQCKEDDSAVEDGLKSNEELRRSPYDVFLTEWEPNILPTDIESDLLNILNPDEEDANLESEDIFTRSFASSLEDVSSFPTNRLSVGPSPIEFGLRTKRRRKSRDENGSACSRENCSDIEPDAWYEYLEIQRQKHLQLPPSYNHENGQANTEPTDFPFITDDRSKSPSMTIVYPSSREVSAWNLPLESDTLTTCRSPSSNRNRSKSDGILKTRFEEETEPVPGVSKKSKDAYLPEDAKTYQVVDSESQFNHEESNSPPRRRWYHKLCPGCKSKRKINK